MNIPAIKQRFILPDLPSADDLIPFLRQIDENRWYTNFGPLAQRFEQDFMAAMAAAHGNSADDFRAVSVASGYQALTVGLRLLGVKPGDKVLVPSITFPACPLAVAHLGAEPVLADIDPETYALTPAIARAAAEKHRLAAIMPVAVYGFPLPAEEWDSFAQDTGIGVLIDAAAAVESQRYLRHGLVAHSLHALKPFGIGEGGLLVTADPAQADAIRQRINFGLQNRLTFQSGENAKLSEYHAAVALAQLARWEGIKTRRRTVWQAYEKALRGLVHVHALHEKAVVSSLMIETNTTSAQAVHDALCASEIAAHRTYLPPLYDHPHFASLTTLDAQGRATQASALNGAQEVQNRLLGLPFHAFMTREDIHETVTILGDCLARLDQGATPCVKSA